MLIISCCFFQVWFQNRRAKFRRNERNIISQRSTLYSPGATTNTPRAMPESTEQPIAARPSPVSPDYMAWSGTSYGQVANNSYPSMSPQTMQASPNTSSCAVAGGGSTGSYSQMTHHAAPAIGTSIANLRLKAREYNMHNHAQTGYLPAHAMTS